jgi:LacI family transcriptional regulator
LTTIYSDTYECRSHIIMYQNNSNTNGSNFTSKNASFRTVARGTDGTTRCNIVVQTNAAFARSVLNAVRRIKKGIHGVSIQAVASQSDEETLELIGTLRHQSDVFALLGKNTERVRAALLELRSARIPVIALISDFDANVRSTYIGSDNWAAGQLAGFIFGRSLERELGAQVAIIACRLAYRCWEDREIGFRSLLRQRFPQISIVEVVMEDDSPQATCEAALRVLKNSHAVGGIYNFVGESLGLAQAINELRLPRRPLYITHELDEVAEPLLRAGVIDFLITQNLEAIVNAVQRFVSSLRTGANQCEELNLVPIELVSKFNLQPRTVL